MSDSPLVESHNNLQRSSPSLTTACRSPKWVRVNLKQGRKTFFIIIIVRYRCYARETGNRKETRTLQMSIFIEDRMIRVLRICGTYYTIWPLNSEDGKLKTLICKYVWWFYTLNILNQSLLTVNGIIQQKGFVNILKSMLETMYTFEIVFTLIYCRIQRKQLQVNTLFRSRFGNRIDP